MAEQLFKYWCRACCLMAVVVCHVGFFSGAVAEDAEGAGESAQAVHAGPLLTRYRQPPTDEQVFRISEMGRLTPGGRWYVTRLIRHDLTHEFHGAASWGPIDNGIYSIGLVAINLKTGDAASLLPAETVTDRFPDGFHVTDDESCFVFTDGIVCEWNLRAGSILRHGFGGASGVIAEFAAAVGQGLRSRIVWPESESDWDGATVKLRATASSPPINFVVTDPLAARDEQRRRDDKWRRPRLLPGSRE